MGGGEGIIWLIVFVSLLTESHDPASKARLKKWALPSPVEALAVISRAIYAIIKCQPYSC